jgi:hypothetical protein
VQGFALRPRAPEAISCGPSESSEPIARVREQRQGADYKLWVVMNTLQMEMPQENPAGTAPDP